MTLTRWGPCPRWVRASRVRRDTPSRGMAEIEDTCEMTLLPAVMSEDGYLAIDPARAVGDVALLCCVPEE